MLLVILHVGLATATIASPASLTPSFEPPKIVHQSYDGQHAWFSSLVSWTGESTLILDLSLGGDGTPCPPPGKVQNCSMTLRSLDNGHTWVPFQHWSRIGINEVVPVGNGSFLTLGYGLTVDYKTNRSAVSAGQQAHVDSRGEFVTEIAHVPQRWVAAPNSTWPSRLVHSGSVVALKDGSLLTTTYGHGEGPYRKWTTRAAIYFVRSTDLGRTWHELSSIPWQAAYGQHADGPGEPTTARLPDGRLFCIFRSDSMSYYWSTVSTDEGRTFSAPRKLAFAWSVKPRLRLTSKGVLVLTGGRPGIDLWASVDGGDTWQRWNLVAEHNKFVATGALPANYTYDAQVVNASGPATPRAQPQPQTSSYTGLVEAADGALVVSYDRLANGWHGPPGVWGECDALFTMRVHFERHATTAVA